MKLDDMSNADLLATLVGRDMAKALARSPLAEVFGFSTPRQMCVGEELARYAVHPALAAAKELFARCFQERMGGSDCLSSPEAVRTFLCARMAHLGHEVFWCLWLDARNHLIGAEELFRGTLAQTSVYPREVVKKALAANAAAVIFAHNHPSGAPEPSRADEMLTATLKSTLASVDVRVLDHFVVAGTQTMSFAARGLL